MNVEALIAGHLHHVFNPDAVDDPDYELAEDDVATFIGVMPDDPDSHSKVVSVYMTGSAPSTHTMKGGALVSEVRDPDQPGITEVEAAARRELRRQEAIDHRKAAIHMPYIQVIARDTTYKGASDLAWMVHNELDGRTDWTLTDEDDNETRIMCIQSMQLPFPSGKDSQDRKLFSHNYQLWVDNYHDPV